jgi:hypothetical protein
MAGPTPAIMLLNTTTRKEQSTGNSLVSSSFTAGQQPATGCPDSTGYPCRLRASLVARPCHCPVLLRRCRCLFRLSSPKGICFSLAVAVVVAVVLAAVCFCRHPELRRTPVPLIHPYREPFQPRIGSNGFPTLKPKVIKILSSPQVTQKREIPNNDAPFKFKENGVVATLNSLQLNQRLKRETLLRLGRGSQS